MPDEKKEENKKEEMELEAKNLDKKISLVEAERLEAKRQELLKMEERLDRKMGEFRQFVNKTELVGEGMSGLKQKTEEEKAIEASKKMLEGTGLDPFK